MSITVIPAYRVIRMFLKDVEGLPYDAMMDALETKVRNYVQHLLSGAPGGLGEIGQRTALAQLGDPELAMLSNALEEIETGNAKEIVEDALQRCTQLLPRHDLSARVLLLPGDGQSRVITQQMKGVIGLSIGSQATLLFLWPTDDWKRWLTYTMTHEYTHPVRNLLFPRSLAGNRLVYQKSQTPETLLDAMISEGIADVFAMALHPDLAPPWTNALSSKAEASVWPKVRRRLAGSDTTDIRRFLFGDNDRIPVWTGYTIGYKIVRGYLAQHSSTRPANLVGLTADVIFEGSGYQPGQSEKGQES